MLGQPTASNAHTFNAHFEQKPLPRYPHTHASQGRTHVRYTKAKSMKKNRDNLSPVTQQKSVSPELYSMYREWQAYIDQQYTHAPLIEKLIGPSTIRIIRDGKNAQSDYETFTVSKWYFPNTDDDSVWICFPGVGAFKETPFLHPRHIAGIPEGSFGPLKFLTRLPNKFDLVPHEGHVYVFNGPTAIAGYSPEQCIRATRAVKEKVDSILNDHPRKKIKVFSFSAGTHLGFYIANQIGKERGVVETCIAIAPGDSIGYGLYKTWLTAVLAKDLFERGITMEEYAHTISEFDQKHNTEYLPSGENLVIHAADRDTVVPKSEPHGTDDLVAFLRSTGKAPTYIEHRGANHFTIPLRLILQQAMGKNPYGLHSYNVRTLVKNAKSVQTNNATSPSVTPDTETHGS